MSRGNWNLDRTEVSGRGTTWIITRVRASIGVALYSVTKEGERKAAAGPFKTKREAIAWAERLPSEIVQQIEAR